MRYFTPRMFTQGMMSHSILNGSSFFSSSFSIALFVLLIIAYWKIYEMAGEEGFAAIIPYYSSYIRFKIAGKKNLFWFDLACQIALPLISLIGFTALIATFIGSGGFLGAGIGMVILVLIIATISVADYVIRIIMNIGIARNFNKSTGFAVGLILLPHVFYPILAFSSSTEYVGGYGDAPSFTDKDDNSSTSGAGSTSDSTSYNTDTDINSYTDAEEASFRDADDDSYGDIEVVENVRYADEESAETEYTNKDEFSDVFKNAVENSTDDTEHVSGDVE